LLIYQPIKSDESENVALNARSFPVSFLYISQVPFTACEKPKELEGLVQGIILKIFVLSGLASQSNPRIEGQSIEKAIVNSCKIRLRPILMTSLSTIAGVLPLILGSGPGEASRLTIGVVIFSGMIFSTFFTLYVIPTVYLMIGKNTQRIDAIDIELEKQLKSSN